LGPKKAFSLVKFYHKIYLLQSMLSKELSLTFFIEMSLTLTETSCGQDRLLRVSLFMWLRF